MAEWSGGTPTATEPGSDEASGVELPAGDLLVLPLDLEPVVEAFGMASTQWRWATAGEWQGGHGVSVGEMTARRVGLDYAGLQAGLALAGRTLSAAEFQDVRFMEAWALRLLARQ